MDYEEREILKIVRSKLFHFKRELDITLHMRYNSIPHSVGVVIEKLADIERDIRNKIEDEERRLRGD